MKNMEGIRCKAFTLPGIDGGEISFSETMDRQSILITAREKGDATCRLHITAAQFEAMCSFDSTFDGLEVKKSAPSEELAAAARIDPLEDPL